MRESAGELMLCGYVRVWVRVRAHVCAPRSWQRASFSSKSSSCGALLWSDCVVMAALHAQQQPCGDGWLLVNLLHACFQLIGVHAWPGRPHDSSSRPWCVMMVWVSVQARCGKLCFRPRGQPLACGCYCNAYCNGLGYFAFVEKSTAESPGFLT